MVLSHLPGPSDGTPLKVPRSARAPTERYTALAPCSATSASPLPSMTTTRSAFGPRVGVGQNPDTLSLVTLPLFSPNGKLGSKGSTRVLTHSHVSFLVGWKVNGKPPTLRVLFSARTKNEPGSHGSGRFYGSLESEARGQESRWHLWVSLNQRSRALSAVRFIHIHFLKDVPKMGPRFMS